MLIVMPLSSEDGGELTNIDKAKTWGMFELNEGKVTDVSYYSDWREIDEFFDCVVVADKNDYVWPFQEESIPVLEAPVQRAVEDVIEAFLFKELYEVKF
jgi:hypothetical protein